MIMYVVCEVSLYMFIRVCSVVYVEVCMGIYELSILFVTCMCYVLLEIEEKDESRDMPHSSTWEFAVYYNHYN